MAGLARRCLLRVEGRTGQIQHFDLVIKISPAFSRSACSSSAEASVKVLRDDGLARDGPKVQTAFGQSADRCRQTRGKRTPENWAQIQQTCPLRLMRPQSRNSFASSQHWSVMGAVLQNGLPTAQRQIEPALDSNACRRMGNTHVIGVWMESGRKSNGDIILLRSGRA